LDALVGLKVGTLTALKTSTMLKTKTYLKQDLKLKQNIKVLLKENVLIKTQAIPLVKTSTLLKTQLKTLLQLEPVTTGISLPKTSFRPPKIPTFKPTTPKPIVVLFPKAKKGKSSNAGLKKAISEVAYLPDFTSRALGLEAQTITEKQAKAKLKKLLTGLEIRRGVRIK